MKKMILLLFISFGITQAQAKVFNKSDEQIFIKLMDGLFNALVENDKAWLESNLSDECTFNDPSGQSLSKASLIQAFSEKGIYILESMKGVNIKYIMNDVDGSGFGNIEVDGQMSTPDIIDVSGTYGIKTSFIKRDTGWKINSITVTQ
ncbi:MAG: nuclear transport factor 2 family protein [Flavobacterium sp.]|nr:nuclear transport factor 2 family protein [Pedobacter sp.]